MSGFAAPAFIGTQAAGAVFSGISGYREGSYGAAVADYNAKVAKVRAEDVRRAAEINYGQEQAANRRVLSSARAGYGASGVAMEGSPMNVMLSSALQGEYNALLNKYSRLSEAEAYESQASMFSEQERYARNRRFGTILTSIFDAGTNVAGFYALK